MGKMYQVLQWLKQLQFSSQSISAKVWGIIYFTPNKSYASLLNLEPTQPANISPQDVPRMYSSNVSRMSPKDRIWPSWGRPELTSWGRPNLTSKRRPWEVVLGCPQDVLRTFPRRPSKHVLRTMWGHLFNVPKFLFFSFETYSIDQIYLKAIQYSRCIYNPVELLRWSYFCKIS